MDTPVGKSYLGTPIMSNVIFTAPDPNYRLPGFEFEDNESFTLNDVLVTVNQAKNIVKTQLVRPQGYSDQTQQQESNQRNWGYAGTVKEYISMGDYAIRLQGFLVGEENGVFPAKALDDLLEYLEFPGNFSIAGKFVNFFEFGQVIVNDYNIAEERGSSNSVPIVINLLSDDYLEVKYDPVQSGVLVPTSETT